MTLDHSSMLAYAIRRILRTVPLLLVASAVIFAVMHLPPSENLPVDQPDRPQTPGGYPVFSDK